MNLLVTGGDAHERRLVALTFHRESPQHLGPFVTVPCGLEEEHLTAGLEAWAATGDATAADALLAAQGGTLFLDEIGRLSRHAQRLLLLFVRQLGGDTCDDGPPLRLAAGNEGNLDQAAADGAFSPPLLDCLDKIHVELAAPVRGAA